jgi:CBS domain-containing protein
MEKATHNSPYLIKEGATIADALSLITDNKHGAIIVVREDLTLVGVVSDGDIRRALVKGGTMLTPVGKLVNPNTITITDGLDKKKESDRLFLEHTEINLIPITDVRNRVVGVASRSS